MPGLIGSSMSREIPWQDLFKARTGIDVKEAGVTTPDEAQDYMMKLDAMKAARPGPSGIDYSTLDFSRTAGKAGEMSGVRPTK